MTQVAYFLVLYVVFEAWYLHIRLSATRGTCEESPIQDPTSFLDTMANMDTSGLERRGFESLCHQQLKESCTML